MLEVEFGALPAPPAIHPPTTDTSTYKSQSITTTNGSATSATATAITHADATHHPKKKYTIADCLVVGQSIKDTNGAAVDERVVLFVKMPEGEVVDEEFVKAVKGEIRRKRTARHVPAEVSCRLR